MGTSGIAYQSGFIVILLCNPMAHAYYLVNRNKDMTMRVTKDEVGEDRPPAG